jgi:anthranilate synthase/aminodeoxychorismate synthase-like glutamine amidotransferase
MLLIIDNYDSFTYNLVQYFGEMGATMEIRRNDQVTLEEISRLKPGHICVSPGPCTPREAGLSNDIIRKFGAGTPLLGVCLGHQCIGDVFGGEVVRAGRLMHGKVSRIHHTGASVFAGMPQDFEATRYHSLIIRRDSLPSCLEITAVSADDETEIMGVRHRELPIHGVQFHPESILSEHGARMAAEFLRVAAEFNRTRATA